MSQQEFAPREQRQEGEAGAYTQQSFYRSNKGKGGDLPKNDHPSTFEEFVPPYRYQAQDGPSRRATKADRRQQEQRTRRGLSPDGDALENGYHPERQAHVYQVPPWARPQHNNRGVLRWVIGIFILILLIKPILMLLGFLFVALAGITIIALIIPLLIFLFLFIMFFVLAIVIFFMFVRRSRNRTWRRGPWITWVK